jgi:hypothetical protein
MVVPYKTKGGDSITTSRVAPLCCGIFVEEVLGDVKCPKDNLLWLSGIVLRLRSSEEIEEADEEDLSESTGLLLDPLLEPFFTSTGRSKEFECERKKEVTRSTA